MTDPDAAAAQTPRFAIVGRVNKGKSSVIATLTEDDRIAVSPLPGTTRTVTEFPVKVDDTVLFTLLDTPGFEQAPAALSWLQEEEVGSAAREARVRAFEQRFRDSGQFVEECTLLAPILAGAGILYVVDGSKPYRDNYRAEMEILRWTGRPRMALINRGGEADHAADWRRALDQYFSVVRDFDAHRATFDERLRLLTTLRELHEPWRAAVQLALDALRVEAERRRVESAHIVCDLMLSALGFSLETRGEQSIEPRKLEQAFHDRLREFERDARTQLARVYHHDRVIFQHAQELARPVFGDDLFAERVWASLGLSSTQLLTTYTLSGALTGGLIDAGVGGASFGTGAALGALLGAGATAWHLAQRFEHATRLGGITDRLRNASEGGPVYRVGPFKHPNFPFVLLDRALRYHDALRNRAHALSAASQHQVAVDEASDLGERLSGGQRKQLAALASRIQRRSGPPTPELHAAMFDLVLPLLPSTQDDER